MAYVINEKTLLKGSVTQANCHLSLVAGTAFVDLLGVDLTRFIGQKLTIIDSSGRRLSGWIKAGGPGETYGSELVTDTGFVDPTKWNCSVNWDVNVTNPGKATCVNAANNTYARQYVSVTSGKLYKLLYTLDSITLGAIGFYITSGAARQGSTSAGNYSCYSCATITGSDYCALQTTGTTSAVMDDASIKQVLTPSIYGVTIVSASGGSTYNWTSEESSFNRNDSSGYTYEITQEYATGDPRIVLSGSSTKANTHISAVAGTAFIDLIGVDLSPYLGHRFVLTDSAGLELQGWIKAAGTGESLSGTEILTNPSFDSGTTGWTAYNSTIASIAGGQVNNCLEVTRTSGTSQGARQTITTSSGKLYKLSCYVKSGSSGDTAYRFNSSLVVSPYTTYLDVSGTSSGSWVQNSGYFSDPGANFYYYLLKDNATAGTMLFDEASLQQVITPSTTGVTITNKVNGIVFNWMSQDTSFNYNDSSGYTFKVIREYPYGNPQIVKRGGVSQTNCHLSLATNTAFVDLLGVDLSPYLGHYIRIIDSANKTLCGWIKAAGTGESLGSDIYDFPATGNLTSGWSFVRGSVVDANTWQTTAGQTSSYCYKTVNPIISGALYKGSFSGTPQSGTVVCYSTGMSVIYLNNGDSNKYFTIISSGSVFTPWNASVSAVGGPYNCDIDTLNVFQVLTPSATGVTITNKVNGLSYNWLVEDTGFNRNDSSGYTYEILKAFPFPSNPPVLNQGNVSQTNCHLSVVNGTAFVDLLGIDLSPYLGDYIEIIDSAGKKLEGWIRAAGTGVTYLDIIGGTDPSLRDGDMELNDSPPMTYWAAYASATLSKQTASPHGGARNLRVAYGGSVSPGAGQTVLSSGALYYLDGWARGDGTFAGRIRHGSITVWQGTFSTSWQQVSTNYFSSTSTVLYLQSVATSSGYSEFDDMTIKQVLTPSITGVTITNTRYGDTFNWVAEQSGFNRNDSSGYTFRILQGTPQNSLEDIVLQGSITRANCHMSLVNGTAFIDLVGVSWDPNNYLGCELRIKDSANKWLKGWLKTKGSGETFLDIIGGSDPTLRDGDMEAVGTTNWTGVNSPTLTKDVTAPHTGSQNLRVAYLSTSYPTAAQTVLTVGALYYTDIWYKSDGVKAGRIRFPSTAWQVLGTPTVWTQSTLYMTAPETQLQFQCYTTGAGYYEFDDVTIKKVLTPSIAGATIVATQFGTTYNWLSEDVGFNRNDSSNYNYYVVRKRRGTSAQANNKIATINGGAMVDLGSDVNLAQWKGTDSGTTNYILVLRDSSGYYAWGYMGLNGSGETLSGSELLVNGDFELPGTPPTIPTNWIAAGTGAVVTSVLDTRTGGAGSYAMNVSGPTNNYCNGRQLAVPAVEGNCLLLTGWAKAITGSCYGVMYYSAAPITTSYITSLSWTNFSLYTTMKGSLMTAAYVLATGHEARFDDFSVQALTEVSTNGVHVHSYPGGSDRRFKYVHPSFNPNATTIAWEVYKR